MKPFFQKKPTFSCLLPLSLGMALLFGSCGGSVSTGGGSDEIFLGGNLSSPNPEDIFDLPNTLPDSFALVSCPQLGAPGIIDVRWNLRVIVNSDEAPGHDFDRDGDIDSLLLVRGDPNPKTLSIQINQLGSPAQVIDPLNINFDTLVDPTIHFGYEWDENLVDTDGRVDDMPQSAATEILPFIDENNPGSWLNLGPRERNLAEQFYIPGNTLHNGNQYGICAAGFEGASQPCPPLPVNRNGLLYDEPGVHVVGANILRLDGILHCSQLVWRILVCPVACHCDAEGNSLDEPNCQP